MTRPALAEATHRGYRRLGFVFLALCLDWPLVGQFPPTIQECSKDETVFVGETAALYVAAARNPPFRYQWGVRDSAIPDATNDVLRIENAGFGDASADYWVTVENEFGVAACERIRLTVLPVSPIPGFIDTGFNGAPGFDRVAILQSDGRIVAGGESGIVRMSSDGDVDSTFINGVGMGVAALVVQPDGKFVGLAGYSGLPEWHRHIFRLNANGSRDSSFAPDFFPPDPRVVATAVSAVGVQSNNKLIVVYRVLWVGSEDDYWLDPTVRRLNSDGSFDESFQTSHVLCDGVQAIAVLPDDSIVVGSHRVIRLQPNGAPDSTFQPIELGPPRAACLVPGAVYCMATQSDGRILIGGAFTTVGTNVIGHVVRLFPDGRVDSSFRPPQFTGREDVIVRALAVQPDGRVLVGGNFEQLDGILREGLARLNADGNLDEEFVTGTGLLSDEEETVTSITLEGGGTALIGGKVNSYWGRKVNGLMRIYLGNFPPDIDADGLPDTWESRFFGRTSILSAPDVDADSDGATNADELKARTDPTRATSVLRVGIVPSQEGWVVEFRSVAGRVYHLEGTSSFETADWQAIGEPRMGTGEIERFAIAGPTSTRFFRVRVDGPGLGIQ